MRPRRHLLLSLALAGCASESAPQGVDGITGVFRSGEADIAYALDVPRGRGRHPAVVLVHGSGRTTIEDQRVLAEQFMSRGFAVLRYDKRGAGSSGGVYRGVGTSNSEEMFQLLASDAARAIDLLAAREGIDTTRLGLVGVSQAGWIIPVAASLAPAADFAILIVGPTVSVGMENYYSALVEENDAPLGGISEKLAAYTGPHGFDPLDHLRRMRQPALWLFGARDRSIPTAECVARLQTLIAEEAKPFSFRVYPLAGHDLGGIIWPDVDAWLASTVRRAP
ncbi:MAG TPA: prolyl oligopeptidase family serine peptidase [Gemmatimonadaceae bacterium]|nr:prolyl oligopeptidase family serine peptidase [Gemmatimonadaceae bacterium]